MISKTVMLSIGPLFTQKHLCVCEKICVSLFKVVCLEQKFVWVCFVGDL